MILITWYFLFLAWKWAVKRIITVFGKGNKRKIDFEFPHFTLCSGVCKIQKLKFSSPEHLRRGLRPLCQPSHAGLPGRLWRPLENIRGYNFSLKAISNLSERSEFLIWLLHLEKLHPLRFSYGRKPEPWEPEREAHTTLKPYTPPS